MKKVSRDSMYNTISDIPLSEPRLFPEKHFTYADSRHWPDDERWEILKGVAVDITEPPGTKHQEVLRDLFMAFHKDASATIEGMMMGPFEVLLAHAGTPDHAVDTIVQPDLMFSLHPEKFTDRFFRGVPEFIAEVICPFRSFLDLGTKLDVYEEYGVPEYWLLHPTEHWLLKYVLTTKGAYARGRFFRREDLIAPEIQPELKIDLSKVFPEREPRPRRLKTEFISD